MRLLGPKRLFILFCFIACLGLFAYEGTHILAEREIALLDDLEVADCGVVLTGGPGRIREAMEIFAQKKIKKLIISGVYKDAQLNEIFPNLPFYPEINPAQVILEKRSESTFGNAIQSLALVQSLQCRNIILITSQLHMHRAYKIFRTIYPETIEIRKFGVWPNRRDFYGLDFLLEATKSVFYTVFGRVL